MDRAQHGAGAAAGRIVLVACRALLVALPWLSLRALLAERDPPLSRFNDRQLADIGLTRADVESFHGRPAVGPEFRGTPCGRDCR